MIDLTHARQQVVDGGLVIKAARLTPFLNGPEQLVKRIGTRHRIKVQMPPMMIESEGRRWISRLIAANQEGGFVAYPQVDFQVGAPGSPTVPTETVGGMLLPITGGAAHYAIREGQALHIESAGRRYFYFAREQVILDASGAGVVKLDVPMRKVASPGDKVELARPVIEGWIDGDGWGWTLETNRTTGLGFSITERA